MNEIYLICRVIDFNLENGETREFNLENGGTRLPHYIYRVHMYKPEKRVLQVQKYTQ